MTKAEQILQLIMPFVEDGSILPRTFAEINHNINDFVVLEQDGKLLACAGLKDCREGNMGEIYCLAVSKNAQKIGLSAQLLGKIMIKAKAANFCKIFALSKYNIDWFIRQGFVQMKINQLPKKRQALFNHQRNSSIFFKDVE